MAAVSSAGWIQEKPWRPLPIGPPANSLNGRSSRYSAPSVGLSTTPERMLTWRTP